MVIKATGAIEKVYSLDVGEVLFGTIVVHHWDERTGMRLQPLPGSFVIHPERQEHQFTLTNGVAVHETLFVLNGEAGRSIASIRPARTTSLELRNDGPDDVQIGDLRVLPSCAATCRTTSSSTYDARLHAFVAWNATDPDHVRLFAMLRPAGELRVDVDHAKAISGRWPGALSRRDRQRRRRSARRVPSRAITLAPGRDGTRRVHC